MAEENVTSIAGQGKSRTGTCEGLLSAGPERRGIGYEADAWRALEMIDPAVGAVGAKTPECEGAIIVKGRVVNTAKTPEYAWWPIALTDRPCQGTDSRTVGIAVDRQPETVIERDRSVRVDTGRSEVAEDRPSSRDLVRAQDDLFDCVARHSLSQPGHEDTAPWWAKRFPGKLLEKAHLVEVVSEAGAEGQAEDSSESEILDDEGDGDTVDNDAIKLVKDDLETCAGGSVDSLEVQIVKAVSSPEDHRPIVGEIDITETEGTKYHSGVIRHLDSAIDDPSEDSKGARDEYTAAARVKAGLERYCACGVDRRSAQVRCEVLAARRRIPGLHDQAE